MKKLIGLLLILAAMQVNAAPVAATPALCNGKPITIYGTNSDDFILGTNGNDVIAGLDGVDQIYGNRGDDTICGGDGNEHIHAGIGNDTVLGQKGDDHVEGCTGNDTILLGQGNDFAEGDCIYRDDFGVDTINGGLGRDAVTGSWGYLKGLENDQCITDLTDEIGLCKIVNGQVTVGHP